MPTQIHDYRVLCETLDFLCIDVLSGRDIRSIMGDLRSGKHYWNEQIFKTWARDSAFRLLYLFLLGDFESDVKDSNRAYNAALFVVSHCGIFEHRTRKMIREAYEERFDVSAKQLRELDKWAFHPPVSDYSEDDGTTESEDLSFDFDYDYYSDRS
ncbi:uncharacterized protein N7500_003525 [Penicillium coprophilum]|uniref:uncharacterized protein n=1 Tax=Penicillium coprophilum TaxID=36646 RepID=UPI002383FD9E|nr:uncharacterized protein N7500_003525 [Penicillium coprophilum]KAJ5170742.1 hypothetical protein N7500_003525 [Penicillium coprophilum]